MASSKLLRHLELPRNDIGQVDVSAECREHLPSTSVRDFDWTSWQSKYPKNVIDDPNLELSERLLKYPAHFKDVDSDIEMAWITGYFPSINLQAEIVLQEVVDLHVPKTALQPPSIAKLDDDIMQRLEQLILPTSNAERPNEASRLIKEGHPVLPSVKSVNLKVNHPFVPTAQTFPFPLDNFQRAACHALEFTESNLFIAASTSSGKTVIAEYAVALSLRHLRKTIYTSPIKALSNQKYREFSRVFNISAEQAQTDMLQGTEAFRKLKRIERAGNLIMDDGSRVGIITGDIQVNPTASCMIMTTEILRSLLYRSSSSLNDVEFIIFDEIHYMNDQERGFVWEELIIGLPRHIRLIFLSATIPNVKEFAGWVQQVRSDRDITLVEMMTRPVPLEFYYWHDKELVKVVDKSSFFCTDNYNKLKKDLTEKAKKPGSHIGSLNSILFGLIGYQKRHEGLPMVIFTFSRKQAESLYEGLTTDLSTPEEKQAMQNLWEDSMKRLSLKPSDYQLPQFSWIKQGLLRGIGIHHSGVLPSLKEVVELAMTSGLVKVLFATETFAVGLNMPTKCVTFVQTRKIDYSGGITTEDHHDGKFRDLNTSEFLQMAGRAGRRGLDPYGAVILLPETQGTSFATLHDATLLKKWILGSPVPLASQFRLTWRTILHFLQSNMDIQGSLLSKSYLHHHSRKLHGNDNVLKDQLSKLEDDFASCSFCKSGMIKEYAEIRLQQNELLKKLIESINLEMGQVVELEFKDIGIILGFKHRSVVIIRASGIFEMARDKISRIYDVTVDLPQDLLHVEFVDLELCARLIASICLSTCTADALSNYKFKDFFLSSYQVEYLEHASLLRTFQASACPNLLLHLSQYLAMYEMEQEVIESNVLFHLPEYRTRLEILSQFCYIKRMASKDREDVHWSLLLKGKMALQIMTMDEFLITECMADGMFLDVVPEELVALLSMFVYKPSGAEKSFLIEDWPTLKLEQCYTSIKDLSASILVLFSETYVDAMTQAYFSSWNTGLVPFLYHWSKGQSFNKLIRDYNPCELSEGILVRNILRIGEACRDIQKTARVLGNEELFSLAVKAEASIKRDICFTPSLYI